jgi:hypothetical protein
MTKIQKDDEARFNETTKRDDEQEKGDEVLRRLLKTPPDPKTGKGKIHPPIGSGGNVDGAEGEDAANGVEIPSGKRTHKSISGVDDREVVASVHRHPNKVMGSLHAHD